jgi:uncharacterized damage-inducible protein DinB
MDEKMFFQQLDFYRHLTIAELESIDEEKVNIVPEGFNNSILWNAGHVYVATEYIIIRQTGEEMIIPEGYGDMFNGGTKPADWTSKPPKVAEIKKLLTEQTDRIKAAVEGKLNAELIYPFEIPNRVKFTTIAEVLNFALYHEGQHTGFMKGLKKALTS